MNNYIKMVKSPMNDAARVIIINFLFLPVVLLTIKGIYYLLISQDI